MSEVNLDFLAAQSERILEGQRVAREENQALALTLGRLSDAIVGLNRTLNHLDRRVSEVRDDVETTIRAELLGHRNSVDQKTETKLTEFELHLIEMFDKRYRMKADAE